MPAYNEEGAIADAVREIQTTVLDLVPEAEFLVIDDGSRDRTGAILDELALRDERIQVIHQANGGHGRAVRTGLDDARGDYLFLVDSDRQIPIEAFPDLWRAVLQHDAALGIRTNRQDATARLIITRMVRATIWGLFGVRLRDANVPFKIVRREVWEAARASIPPETLAPSLFLAVFVARNHYDFVEVPVPHRARQTGVVSIRHWKLLKFCARGLGQMLAFRGRLQQRPAVSGVLS
jgi:glycosyltransferase involved in cell wall biosynthesis